MKKLNLQILFKLTSLVLLTLATACYYSSDSQKNQNPAINDSTAVFATDAGEQLTVEVDVENVRARPNGKIVGKLRKGEQITVIRRVANWVHFRSEKYRSAYIWGPSVGYIYENLYNPAVYYDANSRKFYDIEYFQRMFSQKGEPRRENLPNTYELFFGNIGLGSHQVTVLDAATAIEQLEEHGVTLFVDRKSEQITKVRVDYFRPVRGFEAALKKSELPTDPPTTGDSGHLTWAANALVPGLIVDLERLEWDSELFSGIWFILPEKK